MRAHKHIASNREKCASATSKLKVYANRPFFMVTNFHRIQSCCKLIPQIEMIVISNTYPHHTLLNDVMDGHALPVSVENHRAINFDTPHKDMFLLSDSRQSSDGSAPVIACRCSSCGKLANTMHALLCFCLIDMELCKVG